MWLSGRALEAERQRLQERAAAEASRAALRPAGSMDEPGSPPPQQQAWVTNAQGLTPRRALQQEADALRSKLQAGLPFLC